MVTLIAQKVDQLVVVPCIGGLTAPALAEHELACVLIVFSGREALRMHEDAFRAVLGASDHDLLPCLEVPVLDNVERAVRADDDRRVHPALLGKHPFAAELEVLRIHRGAVEAFRSDAVLDDTGSCGIRCLAELRICEIGLMVGRQGEGHGWLL